MRLVFYFYYDIVVSLVVRFVGRFIYRGGFVEVFVMISVIKIIFDVLEYDNVVVSNRVGERERERVRVRWKFVRWGVFFFFFVVY